MQERLDLIYRRLGHPVDHVALLEHLIAAVNTPWFASSGATDELTMNIVRKCHQLLWGQQGKSEAETINALIKMSRTWDRQSKELRDCPAKHLLRWNATLIQSVLLDAFS